jgi:hypothetical protein
MAIEDSKAHAEAIAEEVRQLSLADRAAAACINAIFLPADWIKPHTISKGMQGLIVAILVITAAFAEPHVREKFATFLGGPCWTMATKEWGKEWSDFAVIVFQVLIAIMIGGIAITEDVVNATKGLIAKVQTSYEKKSADDRKKIEEELRSLFKEMEGLTLKASLVKAKGIFDRLKALGSPMGEGVPDWYARWFYLRFGASFPGGFYGILALCLFEGLIISGTAKTYFDYHHACPAAAGAVLDPHAPAPTPAAPQSGP